MSTLKGTTMHPRCRHIDEIYLNVDFSSSAQVKFNFELFWKKNQIFGSHVVVLVKTFPLTYQLLMWDWYWQSQLGRFLFSAYGNSGYGQNSISSISNFLKNIHIFGFPWRSTRDHSIDASITNVGLILAKLRWFQLFIKIRTFLKKKRILGFPWCSTREDLSIDVSITNVGLILTKLWCFQLFVENQNSNFEHSWKKNPILGFPWCSNREDLSIDV